MFQQIFICVLYSVLSTCCILHNKFILSKVMPYENLLLLLQNVFTIVFILVFGKYTAEPKVRVATQPTLQAEDAVVNDLSKPSDTTTPTSSAASGRSARVDWLNVLSPKFTLYHSKGDWVVGLCYSFSVVTGMWCLFHLTVPTFSAVKKSGMLISWGIEAWNPTTTTWACLPGILLVIVGTAIQTWYDLDFSLAGVIFGAMSCVFQSLAYEIGKRMVTHGKDLWSVLMINSVVSLVVQLLYMAVFDELGVVSVFVDAVVRTSADSQALALLTNKVSFSGSGMPDGKSLAPRATAGRVAFHVTANCVLIMAMNFSIFLNCFVNSPLAHVVTGNVKGVITTIAGIVLFSLTLHERAYAGILVGFVGGVWFSVVKYKEEARRHNAARVLAEKSRLEAGREGIP